MPEPTEWANAICQSWSDVCEPRLPLHISVIEPQPARIFSVPNTVHIMVEQYPEGTRHMKALLLSVAQAFRSNHFAISVMPHIMKDMLLRHSSLVYACLGPWARFQCTVIHRRQELGPRDVWNLPTGSWLTIDIDPIETVPQMSPRNTVVEDEENSMMQIDADESRKRKQITSSATPEYEERQAADSSRDLFHQLLDDACWVQADMKTWFVDRMHHPTCHQYRTLRIRHVDLNWREELTQLWTDVLDSARPVRVVLVSRETRCPGYTGQRAILWQSPKPGHVVSMVVVCPVPFRADLTKFHAQSVEDTLTVADAIQKGNWHHPAY